MFRFKKFNVYKDALAFAKDIRILSKCFPKEELFGLKSQVTRAADSVVLNIAEGSDRGTDKDFAHFLNNAHTSLNEVVSCLDIALDNEYIMKKEHLEYLSKAENLANQLTAFRKKLLNHPTK